MFRVLEKGKQQLCVAPVQSPRVGNRRINLVPLLTWGWEISGWSEGSVRFEEERDLSEI